MSSVLALVSKAVFEGDAPSGLDVGDVWPIDRWNSKNPALKAVADGGALFLVTVRPPERLWLVGVLEAPVFEGDHWVAKANAVQAVDITSSIPKLVFATGKGLKAEPGKLGMSLQTPRALADSDVALLRDAAGVVKKEPPKGDPSIDEKVAVEKPVAKRAAAAAKAPTKKAPTPTPQAPGFDEAQVLAGLKAKARELTKDVAKELEAILALTSAPKALAGAKALAKKAGEGKNAVAIYDAVAAAILEGPSKTKTQAGDCHAAARTVERKLGLPVDLDEAVARARALGAVGAVWGKEVALLAKALVAARRFDLAPALTEAAIATVAAGEIPTKDLLARIAALGAEHAERALGGFARGFWKDDGPKQPWERQSDEELPPPTGWAAGSLARAEDDFWEAAAPLAKSALDRSPELLDWMVARRQVKPHQANLGWLAALTKGDVPARLAAAAPERARELVERILHTVGPACIDATALAGMRAALEPLVPTLVGRRESIGAGHDPRVLDLLLSLGAPLDASVGGTSFHGWAQDKTDHPHMALEHLGPEHALYPILVRGFVDTLANAQLTQVAAKAAETPALWPAFEGFIDKIVGGLADHGTVGAFLTLSGDLALLCQPKVLEAFPSLGRSLRAIEPEHLLWRQLQGGVMDEWGWPAFDQTCDLLGPGAVLMGGCFPHGVVRKDDRWLVAGPDEIVLDVRDPLLMDTAYRVYNVAFLDGDLFVPNTRYAKEGNVSRGRWLRKQEDVDTGEPGSPVHKLLTTNTAADYSDGHDLRPVVDPELMKSIAAARWSKKDAPTVPFLLPVPAQAQRSPLGARDGVGGLFLSSDMARRPWVESIDGRRFEGRAGWNWSSLQGIFAFPERDGVYPIAPSYGGTWIYLPDGLTPLTQLPAVGGAKSWVGPMWSGSPLKLEGVWWHLFVPRDPAGSRALRDCSLEQATDLFHAATANVRPPPAAPETKDLSAHYPGLQVTVTAAPEPSDPVPTAPGLVGAIHATLPGVTHPRLIEGVAGLATLAASLVPRIAELKTYATRTADTRQSALTNRDVRGLDTFFEANFDLPGRWGQDRLGQQIEDVAAFLFGERAVPLHRPAILTPASCFVAWERMLIHGAELVLVLLSAPVPAAVRAQARAFLELYRSTALATNAGHLRLIGLRFDPPFAPELAGSDHMVEWDNRYFLRSQGGGAGAWQGAAVEAAGTNGFKVPPGATLLWQRAEAPLDAEAIAQALRLIDERGPIPIDAKAAQALSEATGLLELAAARMLNGCFWIDPDPKGRTLFGATLARLAHARTDLWMPRTDFHPLISGAIPRNLEELYRPLEKGADGLSFVERLASRWNAEAGKKSAIAMELVERLEDEIRQPRPPFVEAARAMREPESVPRLTRDAAWVHRPFDQLALDALQWGRVPDGWPEHKDEAAADWVRGWPDKKAFSYDALSDFSKYLSWAYLELPVGDPLRRSAGRIAQLIRQRLATPEHLMPIAMGPGGYAFLQASFQPVGGEGAGFKKFYDELQGKPYAASAGPSAVGKETAGLLCLVPGDPKKRLGGFFSLRTAAFHDLEGLERALAPLGPGLEVAGAKLQVFPYLPLLRLWLTPSFQRLVADLDRPAQEIGQFVANPVVSAPDAVAAVMARHDLPEDAASLWLQLRWLPEPGPDRVMRYGHWSRDRYRAAAGSLLARKLIVEAAPRGTSQTHFLPGPLVYFDRYPGPVEASKLAHLGLVEGKIPPLNVPLLLGPAPEHYRSQGDGSLTPA